MLQTLKKIAMDSLPIILAGVVLFYLLGLTAQKNCDCNGAAVPSNDAVANDSNAVVQVVK